jgi:hypothetical protein
VTALAVIQDSNFLYGFSFIYDFLFHYLAAQGNLPLMIMLLYLGILGIKQGQLLLSNMIITART